MYMFEDQMCLFEFPESPKMILPLVSLQKLDWTCTWNLL